VQYDSEKQKTKMGMVGATFLFFASEKVACCASQPSVSTAKGLFMKFGVKILLVVFA